MGVRSLTVWRRARKIHSRRVAPRPVSDLISECGLRQPPHTTTKFSAWPVTFLAEGDGFDGVPSSETRVYLCCVRVNFILRLRRFLAAYYRREEGLLWS